VTDEVESIEYNVSHTYN